VLARAKNPSTPSRPAEALWVERRRPWYSAAAWVVVANAKERLDHRLGVEFSSGL